MTDTCIPEPPELFRRLDAPPLVGLLTRRNRNKIKASYIMAKYGHRWQKRKLGGRYIDHPKGVVWIMLDELGIIDAVMICAGLLHDCPEDTRDVDVDLIEDTACSEVAQLVLQVSKLPKAGFYERLCEFGDPRALIVKGCDRLDNLRTLEGTERDFIEKQYRQTSTEFMPLMERLLETAPPQYAAAARKLVELIRLELAKIRALLDATPA